MAIEGSLKDISLANLIQLNCQEMNEVKIILNYLDKEGVIFISEGNLNHAQMGTLSGVEVVYELLRWRGGTFQVINNVKSPKKNINKSWNSILLEGMQLIDEGDVPMVENLDKLTNDLKEMSEVTGAIVVARDGTVLAESVESNAEKEGAVTVFLGNAADQIGETLALGSFNWGIAELGQERMLVLEQPDFFIGLLLTEKASPAMVAAKVEEAVAT